MIYITIAFLAGIAIAIQAAINSQLAQGLLGQPILAAAISFAIGTIFLFSIALWKADINSAWNVLPQQPWWRFLGGILGAIMVFTTVLLAPKIGITNMLFFVIIGQLIAAAIIDHFGLIGMAIRPFQLYQLIGLFIVLIGLATFFFGKHFFH